jgi:hypothetical protein
MKHDIYAGLTAQSRHSLKRFHHRQREERARLLLPLLLLGLAWAIWFLIRTFQLD